MKILFQKMEEKIEGRNITITKSPVQTLHKISLEYDFDDPKFEVLRFVHKPLTLYSPRSCIGFSGNRSGGHRTGHWVRHQVSWEWSFEFGE